MHSISIKNFGPLVNVEMQTNKITFLLGEQASGKSTFAKLIHFFRIILDELFHLVCTTISDDWLMFRNSCLSLLRMKFIGIFGEIDNLGDFDVSYSYGENVYVTIKPSYNENYLDITISPNLDSKLMDTWNKAQQLLPIDIGSGFDLYLDTLNISEVKDTIDKHMVYVPAGRAFLSHQSLLHLIQTDEIKRINPYDQLSQYDIIDAPTRNYISEVRRVREWFLSPQTNERRYEKDKDPFIKYLKGLTKSILKGSYEADRQNDYVRISDAKNVKISYASSGQQEVIWLLNLLYIYAVEKRKCMLIIEEPETHLHPEAQYMLAKCIAAFCNYTDSQIIITTHSPYVLSSFNNLTFAGKCGKLSAAQSKLNEIIPKESWLEPESFSAYILEQGEIRSIKDEDLSMVDIAELDAVASSQDTEYEKMLSLYSEVR